MKKRKKQDYLQLENPTHTNKQRERERSLELLEKARLNSKSVVFLKQGASMDFEKFKKNLKK